MSALYTNIQRFSIHDGGGIRTVVFLKGCPFTCPWCCNPENLSFAPEEQWHERLCIGCSMVGEPCLAHCRRSADECPTGARELVGTPAEVGELLDAVRRDRIFYEESNGGVTVSGGECLAGQNQAFTLEFLEACKAEGLRTAVETTLAVVLENPGRLAAACDCLLVDFKIADPARSSELLRLDVGLRDRNLRQMLGLGVPVVARLPIIPGFTDAPENVRANALRAAELGISRADILPFHQLGSAKYDALGRNYALRDLGQLSEEGVAYAVSICEEVGLTTVVHGE